MTIFVFQSIHFVLKAEGYLRKAKINLEIIPTPRHVSSDCGMSIKINSAEVEQAKTILSENGIVFMNYSHLPGLNL